MSKNNEDKEKIHIKIDNTDNALGWLEKMLILIKNYGIGRIIGATFLLVIVSIFIYAMFNITQVFEVYDAWKARQHDDKMEMRMEMAPKIQSLIDKLTYSVDATRTMVLEMHNGNTGSGGLPFTKCTATYESLNIGKHPIAQQYQDVNITLMPFVNKLFTNGYWYGNTDDLLNIDKALYYKMKSNGTEHFAACVIEGVDNKAIAFLIVSFDETSECSNKLHDCIVTRNSIRHISMELAVLLEVTRLVEMKK